jgi:hypothetical protein
MKPYKRILSLSAFVTAILVFWLMPRINKATEIEYKSINDKSEERKFKKKSTGDTLVRTGNKKVFNSDKAEKTNETLKKYSSHQTEHKKENEKSEYKLRSKMYSRGMHFTEIEEGLSFDSIGISETDTAAVKIQ